MEEKELQQLIVKVITAVASEKEMNTFYSWVNSSPENKELYLQMKGLYDTRRSKFFLDKEKTHKDWEIISKKMNTRNEIQLKRKLFIRYISAAAAILLILLSSIFIIQNRRASKEWLVAYNEPGNIPMEITLTDGSKIKLNASSEIKYPQSFSGKYREVYLNGEALFTVRENKNNPFIVHSGNQKVTVLGTIFNINSYATMPNSETTLISGKVKLDIINQSGNIKREIILSKNQQLRLDKKTLSSELRVADAENIISWTNNEYIFKNTSFEEILDRLSSIHNVKFISSSKLKNERYTGKFKAEQSLDEILDILNFKNQFKYTQNGDTILIVDK